MASSTDTFNFNSEKMFAVLRESLPDELNVTQNLIESKDDMLFAWNSKNSCILALNWACGPNDKRASYQTLIPSAQQNYFVNRVLPSNEGNLLAICGNRGVSIIELPRRWGVRGLYENGKDSIICRTYNLDERLFIDNSHLQVLQIRWHPASPTDSQFLVLLSDNTIRVYDDTSSTFSLKHVWRVGPAPSLQNASSNTSCPVLYGLGDSTVDFDIAPPKVSGPVDVTGSFIGATKIEWPILVLRENGNVYILCAGVDTDRPRLQGPLSMFPQVQDNYGVDSCSILVLPSLPPTVVIAESSGKIHNALLMEADPSDEAENSFDELDYSLIIDKPDWSLYVLETIELELGLSGDFSCPLFLKKDVLNDYRYFVYHNTGLHAISANFILQLENYVKGDNSDDLPALTASSGVEYLVCTKALNSPKLNPVLGCTLCRSPSGLILFLASGQVISLDLISDTSLLQEWPSSKALEIKKPDSQLKSIFKDSFINQIQSILKSDLSQPILKHDKSANPTPQEAFELLMQATQIFREKHFPQHDKAKQEIEKRVTTLKVLKEQQLKEIQFLQNQTEEIRDKAETLAETYEEACEKQQALLKRAQDVVRLATLRLPQITSQEKDFANSLEKIKASTDLLQKSLEKAKLRVKAQENLKDYDATHGSDRKFVLPNNKDEIIRKILSEMNSQIEALVTDVKKINVLVS